MVRRGIRNGPEDVPKYSRAIVDAILDGSLQNAPTLKDPVFGLEMITECPAVPNEVLQPKLTWSDPDAFDRAANRLAAMFVENFKKFEKNSPAYIAAAGPVVLQNQNTKVSETV